MPPAIARVALVGTHVVVHRQPELFEITLALSPAARFAGDLNGRQEHGDQDTDDGNHDQQFHERETAIGTFIDLGALLGHHQRPQVLTLFTSPRLSFLRCCVNCPREPTFHR